MTVVIGTAGHIDHGKTTLLRALTGIDADRLPEERRRGMTIDVGYAHLALPDGTELDFVDVPGHDRLIGNMLVGAGEIDAAMLVVAADDGPRAQTLEHLELLDALSVDAGVAVVTKADVTGPDRAAEVAGAVARLLAGTSLGGSPVLVVSSVTGSGLDDLRTTLLGLRDRVLAREADAPAATPGRFRLAIDRSFTVKGRGTVVTGTLRGGPLDRGSSGRLVPGPWTARAREIQVHGAAVVSAGRGRVAINVAGVDAGALHRGLVLTDDPAVGTTDRLLVRLAAPLPDRARVRVHLGTASVDGALSRSGRDAIDLGGGSVAAILRLAGPVAAAAGDRFVLRRPSGERRIVGGVVLDISPARGISRRRQTTERVAALASAIAAFDRDAAAAARLELHGAVTADEGGVALARDVADRLDLDVPASHAGDRLAAAADRPGAGGSAAPAAGQPGRRSGGSRRGRGRRPAGGRRHGSFATAAPSGCPDRARTARSTRRWAWRWIGSNSRWPCPPRPRSRSRPRLPAVRRRESGSWSVRAGSFASNPTWAMPRRPTASWLRRRSRSARPGRSRRPHSVTPRAPAGAT